MIIMILVIMIIILIIMTRENGKGGMTKGGIKYFNKNMKYIGHSKWCKHVIVLVRVLPTHTEVFADGL